jgi:hypothetical protein
MKPPQHTTANSTASSSDQVFNRVIWLLAGLMISLGG